MSPQFSAAVGGLTQRAIEHATPLLCGPHVRYARMDGITMAEWLTKAVETQASKQEANQVLLPGKPSETPLPSPTIELGDAAAALQAMAAAAQAGLPVTKAAVRDTVSLMREQVRVCRGLPARQTRKPFRQTMRLEHEAPEPEGTQDQSLPPTVTRNGLEGEGEEEGGLPEGQAPISKTDNGSGRPKSVA